MANIITDPNTGLPAIEHDGILRVLACLPTEPNLRARFKSFNAVAPVIPRSEWKPVNLRTQFDDSWILDQKSHGSCVGFASSGALMKCRAMSGQAFQKLSGSFTYSFINGGRDQGASIGDSLDSLMKNGTCLDAECGWDRIYQRQIPAAAFETAKRFKISEGYRVDSFDEAGTAIQLGFTLVYAVMVGRTFDSLDGEDVIGYDPGSGNHAVHASGLYQSQRWGWCLDGWNSWAVTWGNRGRFRSAEKHWNGVQQDAFAVRVSSFDPQNPVQPPVAN